MPKEKLEATGGAGTKWVADLSQGALRVIEVLEFLGGAADLILPAALGVAPVLVPLAATGAVSLFVGPVITRLRRGERATILIDLVNLAMAAFVASGRFGPRPFAARRATARAAPMTARQSGR